MSATTAKTKTPVPAGLDLRVLQRIHEEGYGPGAWHGPDLRAALADVGEKDAFWRPAPGRHNVAEIAVHHAFCVRNVRAQLSGAAPDTFVLEGEDWFALEAKGPLSWTRVRETVEAEESRLGTLLADLAEGRGRSPLPPAEQLDLVLGVACHAVYHAGQVQLLRRLREAK